jgi:epoxyqueuosine reductase
MLNSEQVKAKAVELGFNLVGTARAEPSPMLAAYEAWIASGMHGEMGYMARADRAARRRDLSVIMPNVRSMIIVGVDYRSYLPEEVLSDPSRGRIASYAWGLDYHDVISAKLEQFAAWMRAEFGLNNHRVYVDTGAILERSHGQTAGMGFIGKNTMLIHPRRGSYFFLGEILTDAELDVYDEPLKKASMCGSCTRCLTACPTDAFPRPFVLDARRCISYLTIELKGWIERDLRPLMGNWIFGCDVCQDVCPWQRFSAETDVSAFFASDIDRATPPILELLDIDAVGFASRFAGSPVERIGRDRLVRNACIAAGNWGSDQAVDPLLRLLTDSSSIVRGHAAWALGRIMDDSVKSILRRAYDQEADESVRSALAVEIETRLG